MSTRCELEARLATAEAEWRRANDELSKSQADLVRANANWGKAVADRRKAEEDRRKIRSVSNKLFPERRRPDGERRNTRAEVAALSRAVADRHEIYVDRSTAEANWIAAEERVTAAAAERDKAFAALDALDCGQSTAYRPTPSPIGQTVSASSRKSPLD